MESSIITDITSSANLERKMHLKGKVLKTSTAGAIVDIGVEQPALLHVSQILTPDNQPLKRVSDVLAEGQKWMCGCAVCAAIALKYTMRAPFDLEWRDLKKTKL
jgi:polyribonucleotide nucleotidyltransferase